MKHLLRMLLPLALFAMLLSACAAPALAQPEPTHTAAPTEAVVDEAALVTALQAAGLAVEPADVLEQPFFSVKGQVYQVNGEDLQIYAYDDPAKLDADAALIGPDGTQIGNSAVRWMAPPHFFKSGKVIALYLGENKDVLAALEQALGAQFAGQ